MRNTLTSMSLTHDRGLGKNIYFETFFDCTLNNSISLYMSHLLYVMHHRIIIYFLKYSDSLFYTLMSPFGKLVIFSSLSKHNFYNFSPNLRQS